MDVSSFYTELMTLWEEYKNYIELPVCTCGLCECNAAALWESLQQRSRVMKFLMGLNEAFEPTRRHILMMKPIPSLEDVFNMVAQDERQKSIKPSTRQDNVVFQNSGPHDDTQSMSSENLADNAAFATQYNNSYRPRHKFHTTPGQQHSSQQSRGQNPVNSQAQSQTRPNPPSFQKTNTVANVMTAPLYLPAPATNAIN
ncbi:unnamed protein product [Microthlaspi erraticum]|uniref:Retrotransposon gag domain-containing protein n=1 Tax=Microthlaspi erraticum TaxID=1685480 RepID=A0A6D2I9K1_9BRAS|nr:unnamed protein product [Microthlaspi erraticum]